MRTAIAVAAVTAALGVSQAGHAGMAEAEKWIDEEFRPSTLSKADQMQEMEWFVKAAEPFQGMEINVLSETIPTHEYESKVLTRVAFEEITGNQGEPPAPRRGRGRPGGADADADQPQPVRRLHQRFGPHRHAFAPAARREPSRDWMAGDGKDVTLPTLDVDRLHRQVVHDRPRRQALPAPRPAVREPLLVPLRLVPASRAEGEVQGDVRLRARRTGQLVGLRGHRRILLGARQGDRRRARLRPHGLRQARARPRLAHDRCVALHGRRRQQGPPERRARGRVGDPHGGGLLQSGRGVGLARRRGQRAGPRSTPSANGTSGCAITRLRGRRATTSTSRCPRSPPATSPSRSSGTRRSPPRWWPRRARATTPWTTRAIRSGAWPPSPHGAYWDEGQKLGYQDAGSWTLFKSTPVDRRKAAWLYAQFTVSKSVSLKKTHVGLTPIRDSDIRHASFTERGAEAGRPRRVLPLARPGALEPDGNQRAGLPQARADLVAADRRRELRRVHPPSRRWTGSRARWTR